MLLEPNHFEVCLQAFTLKPMTTAILIHGPTASGKTALAIAVAKRLGGEIVNADSMQVYRDLERLTARPSAEELSSAPHHLFGHVDAAQHYSTCLLYTSPSPRDLSTSRMPSSA